MSKNLNVGETVHPHSRKSFIRGARCASNKEFRTAISSFHEDISPVKASWHLGSASQNRYGMSVRRSVVPHQSKNDASHNEITAWVDAVIYFGHPASMSVPETSIEFVDGVGVSAKSVHG
jgi:hypothetical protein